jgi:hypothetical protein
MTPSASQIASTTSHAGSGRRHGSHRQWRCTKCNKLLGIYRDGQMHIRTSRGTEYLTGFPVTSACSCGTLNRVTA